MKKITIRINPLQVLPFSWVGYALESSIHGCDLIQTDQLRHQVKQYQIAPISKSMVSSAQPRDISHLIGTCWFLSDPKYLLITDLTFVE